MGTIAIAQEPRIRPWTKHINQKYWHFVSYLKTGLMSIHWIALGDMLADTLTKPLPPETFHHLITQINRWNTDGGAINERECEIMHFLISMVSTKGDTQEPYLTPDNYIADNSYLG